jgi:C4-dicarboxylate-specific signal transduction histidine kinase
MGLDQGHKVAQELRYFGKVTASISHELKNVLAILNEHAGLLQDFTAMAEQGQPLDVERIQRLSASMVTQIGRGDMIVKRMNRFAHSTDHDCGAVVLDDLVTMVVELFARIAATRGVTVEVKTGASGVSITTHPFILETLLGSLLDGLTAEAPGIAMLNIEVRSQNAACQIRIEGLVKQARAVTRVLESNDLKALLGALQATAGYSRESGELLITLPDNIAA